MKKRFRDQILASILETCSDGRGASKTKIVYSSNMNFNTIRPYLDLLINGRSLEIIGGRPALYKTTSKGLEALGHIKALEDLIPGLKAIDSEG
jgi:predicted transcriptional regulator